MVMKKCGYFGSRLGTAARRRSGGPPRKKSKVTTPVLPDHRIRDDCGKNTKEISCS